MKSNLKTNLKNIPSIINAMDYFPYGKLLREYDNGAGDRYLTTQHERDKETGLDYRGARYYDSDVARFLSTDPWQAKYPAWSTYNYVMGNPIIFTDPTGKGVEYTKEQAEAMAKRGKENGYTTTVVENPDKEGDYGVNYSRAVNGQKFEGVQFEGAFKGITGGNLPRYNANGTSSNNGSTTIVTVGISANVTGGMLGGEIELGRVFDFSSLDKLASTMVVPRYYISLNYTQGADLSAGVGIGIHKPKTGNTSFNEFSLQGWGEGYGGGLGPFDGGYGGAAVLSGYGPSSWSTQNTSYDSYTGGLSLGTPFGFTHKKGYTWVGY